MTSHSSRGRPKGWPRVIRDRVREAVGSVLTVLGRHDGFIHTSEPFYLTRDHPWRQSPCIQCFQTIADHAVRAITVFDPRTVPAAYWRIGSISYLVCDRHDLAADADLMALAHRREVPGCPCQTMGAAGMSAFHHAHSRSESML